MSVVFSCYFHRKQPIKRCRINLSPTQIKRLSASSWLQLPSQLDTQSYTAPRWKIRRIIMSSKSSQHFSYTYIIVSFLFYTTTFEQISQQHQHKYSPHFTHTSINNRNSGRVCPLSNGAIFIRCLSSSCIKNSPLHTMLSTYHVKNRSLNQFCFL